jgi:hypothetical protein
VDGESLEGPALAHPGGGPRDSVVASLGTALDRVVDAPAEPPEAVKEAVRRTVERRLSVDSPEVAEVISYAVDLLDPNPREVKRFVNVFRCFVMILTERRIRGLGGEVPLDSLAKLAVLAIRRPGLLTALTTEVADAERLTVFALLEQHAPAHDDEPAPTAT